MAEWVALSLVSVDNILTSDRSFFSSGTSKRYWFPIALIVVLSQIKESNGVSASDLSYDILLILKYHVGNAMAIPPAVAIKINFLLSIFKGLGVIN